MANVTDYSKLRAGKERMYGFFCGGDPRLFQPESESCTPNELENWRAACAEWDRRDAECVDGEGEPSDFVHGPGFTLTLSGFGIGVQWFDGELF